MCLISNHTILFTFNCKHYARRHGAPIPTEKQVLTAHGTHCGIWSETGTVSDQILK